MFEKGFRLCMFQADVTDEGEAGLRQRQSRVRIRRAAGVCLLVSIANKRLFLSS